MLPCSCRLTGGDNCEDSSLCFSPHSVWIFFFSISSTKRTFVQQTLKLLKLPPSQSLESPNSRQSVSIKLQGRSPESFEENSFHQSPGSLATISRRLLSLITLTTFKPSRRTPGDPIGFRLLQLPAAKSVRRVIWKKLKWAPSAWQLWQKYWSSCPPLGHQRYLRCGWENSPN